MTDIELETETERERINRQFAFFFTTIKERVNTPEWPGSTHIPNAKGEYPS